MAMPLKPETDLPVQPVAEPLVDYRRVPWVYQVFAADALLFASQSMSDIAGPLWVFADFKSGKDTYKLWISEAVPRHWRDLIILHELYEFTTPGGVVWDKRSDDQSLRGPTCLDALGFELQMVRASGYDLQIYLGFRAEQLGSMIAALGNQGRHIEPLYNAVNSRLMNLRAQL